MTQRQRGSSTDSSAVDGLDLDSLGGEGGGGIVIPDEVPNSMRPLVRSYQENARISSHLQTAGGVMTGLNSPPPTDAGRPALGARDPDTPGNIVRLGGSDPDDPGIFVDTFNFRTGVWRGQAPNDYVLYDTRKYPNLEFPNNDAETPELGAAFAAVGDHLVFCAGEVGTEDFLDVMFLDTTASDPSWEADSTQLSQELIGPSYTVYDGELWLFGGSETDLVHRIDPTAADGDRVVETDITMPKGLSAGCSVPNANGVAYISGNWHGDVLSKEFQSFNFDTQEFARLADNNELRYDGTPMDEDGQYGPYFGYSFEYNGWVYTFSGDNQHGKVDLAAYSIEDDRWIPVKAPFDPVLTDGPMSPLMGAASGPSYGNLLVIPGTTNGDELMWCYKAPEDPTEYEPDFD